MLLEAFRQVYFRNGDMFQTVGATTHFAIEMHVQVVVRLGIVTATTQLIAHTIASIL